MGAWGAGSFDNDMAADWTGDIADGGAELVEQTLAAAASVASDEYLDSDMASEAIAAAEVVAAAAGRPGTMTAYAEDAIAWGADHPELATDELMAQAIAALDRVAGPQSELHELWFDTESAGEWAGAVAELRGRLAG